MQSIYKNQKKHVCIIFTDLAGRTTLEMFFLIFKTSFFGGIPLLYWNDPVLGKGPLQKYQIL